MCNSQGDLFCYLKGLYLSGLKSVLNEDTVTVCHYFTDFEPVHHDPVFRVVDSRRRET
jgi:hypothetical protein